MIYGRSDKYRTKSYEGELISFALSGNSNNLNCVNFDTIHNNTEHTQFYCVIYHLHVVGTPQILTKNSDDYDDVWLIF